MVSGSLIEAIEEVAVGVQGGLDRGVTESPVDDLWVLSMSNEKCCVGVAEIMKRARLLHRNLNRRLPDSASRVGPSDRSTCGCREEKIRTVAVGREMLSPSSQMRAYRFTATVRVATVCASNAVVMPSRRDTRSAQIGLGGSYAVPPGGDGGSRPRPVAPPS